MRYRLLSVLAIAAMGICAFFVLIYRVEHPYRRVLKIIEHRWPLLLGILVFALVAVISWNRYYRRRRQDR
jgi:hypothetical protein